MQANEPNHRLWTGIRISRDAALIIALAMVATSAAQAQECFVAPDGLVSWWSGEIDASDSEDGNDGSLTNGALVSSGFVGNAFELDGDDDMVLVPDAANLRPSSNLSMAAWVNFAAAEGTLYGGAQSLAGQGLQFILFKSNSRSERGLGSNNGYGLGRRSRTFRFLARAADASITYFKVSNPGDLIVENQWYHVVGTYDGSQASLYVDGTLQSHQGDIPANGAALDHSAHPLVIGRTAQDGGTDEIDFDAAFVGSIDEVMLFERALTAAEVAAIHAAGTSGVCSDEDGDGFRPPDDCDESDALVNPDSPELPGNFSDENCDGNLGECDPCADWKNHGHYVRCVANAVEDLVVSGNLDEEAGDALVTSAAQSEIGKKGFVPLECQ
jgi:hypothetical protein